VRAFNPFRIEDSEDVADALVERICRGIVRSIAAALASGIEEDEAIGVTQGLNVAHVLAAPVFETSEEANVEHKRWPIALDLIVNADAIITSVGYGPSLLRRSTVLARRAVVNGPRGSS
jgi:hypothetical protein